jgi:hypothetical protein
LWRSSFYVNTGGREKARLSAVLVGGEAALDRRVEGDQEGDEDYAEGDDENRPPGVDPGF